MGTDDFRRDGESKNQNNGKVVPLGGDHAEHC